MMEGHCGSSHTDSVIMVVEGHCGSGSQSESRSGNWGESEGDGSCGNELSLLALLPPDHLAPPATSLSASLSPVDHLATIPSHPDHVTEALAWEGFVSLGERGQAEDSGGKQHLQHQSALASHLTSSNTRLLT